MKQELTQERLLKLMGLLKEEKESSKQNISSMLVDYWRENKKADATEKVLRLFGFKTALDPEVKKAFKEYYNDRVELEYDKWLSKVHTIDGITFKIKDFNADNKNTYEVILDESSSMNLFNRNDEGDNVVLSDLELGMVIPIYGKIEDDDMYMIMTEVRERIAEYIRNYSIDYFGIYPQIEWVKVKIDGFAKKGSLRESHLIEYYAETQEELEDLMKVILEQRNLLTEAKYQGREVKLGKIMQGDVKKFKVYVKNEKGNVVKVNFGQKGMNIKKNNPARRKSFRARHNCDNPGPRWKARYWACRTW
jgi:energy-converting hydrogenase A subunit M